MPNVKAMPNAKSLHDAIAAVCPIDGVSIGDWSDRETWRIDYQDRPTSDQQAAAQAALLAFDPAAPANNPVYVPASTVLGRLTAAEYTAIMQASAAQLAAGNGQLAHWLDMARTSQQGIDLSDSATKAAAAALVSGGQLTQARVDVIFAP
jgi:hypothetical protein